MRSSSTTGWCLSSGNARSSGVGERGERFDLFPPADFKNRLLEVEAEAEILEGEDGGEGVERRRRCDGITLR